MIKSSCKLVVGNNEMIMSKIIFVKLSDEQLTPCSEINDTVTEDTVTEDTVTKDTVTEDTVTEDTVTEDTDEEVNVPVDITINTKIENNIYKFNKYINEGTYGTVYMYTNDAQHNIVIKTSDDESDLCDEIKIINKLNKQNIYHESIVPSYIVNDNVILLDCMDGNLTDLFKYYKKQDMTLNECTILAIMRHIVNVCLDLYNNDLCYADLKLDNILYKSVNEYEFTIFLGDIGSIVSKNDEAYCTYPLESNYNEEGHCINKTTDNDIMWTIGVMLIIMINFNDIEKLKLIKKMFKWNAIKNNKEKRNKIIKNIIVHNINNIYGILISRLLNHNSCNSLQEFSNYLNEYIDKK
jgi:serine/threonine protein kinase